MSINDRNWPLGKNRPPIFRYLNKVVRDIGNDGSDTDTMLMEGIFKSLLFPMFPKHFQANISYTSTEYLDEFLDSVAVAIFSLSLKA